MTLVHGTVADGFEEVRAAFAEGVRREPDIGAQLAVYRDGRLVVDLWAADTQGDALTGVYSVTKGAAYLVVALLVQDGLIGLDRSVRHYWPQFTPDVTVRELLGHRAGLIGVEGGFGTREIADDRVIAERLAKQRPYWKPGAGYGYHALVIGALVGEVVRRTTGRSLQQLYEERIRVPYGLDLYLGLPEDLEPRFRKVRRAVTEAAAATATRAAGATAAAGAASPAEIAAEIAARIAAERLDPESLAGIALNQHADPPTDLVDFANSRTVRALGQASAGGVGNARGIARLYAAAVTGVEGGPGPLLRPETIIEFGTPWAPEQDLFLGELGEQFGVGFEAMTVPYPFLGSGAFGHFGAAGSVGFADPGSGLAYGYVRDRFPRPETDPPTENNPSGAGSPTIGTGRSDAGFPDVRNGPDSARLAGARNAPESAGPAGVRSGPESARLAGARNAPESAGPADVRSGPESARPADVRNGPGSAGPSGGGNGPAAARPSGPGSPGVQNTPSGVDSPGVQNNASGAESPDARNAPESASPADVRNRPGTPGPPSSEKAPVAAAPGPGQQRPVTENDRLVAVVHAVRYRSGV